MAHWEDTRPILVAAYEIMSQTPWGFINDGQQLADRFGACNGDLEWVREVRALTDSGYLEACLAPDGPAMIYATPRGRQEVEGWPGPRTDRATAELLVSLLERAAADASLPEAKRAMLRDMARAAREVGVELVANVATELISRATGLEL